MIITNYIIKICTNSEKKEGYNNNNNK